MHRRLPPLAQEFSSRVADALILAEAGEVARAEAAPHSRSRALLHFTRIESLYELAFLKVFVSWEDFLEQTFVRLLCGYLSSSGCEPLRPGEHYRATLSAAETAILANHPYVLWHNPARVVSRCQRFFSNGQFEAVIASNSTRIEAMAHIRHRIVHSQADALRKCHAATMLFAGVRYRGARAGRFLRDTVPYTQPPMTWLRSLSTELEKLAMQMA